MAPDLEGFTIVELGRRLRARTLTALEITDACLARIEADNPGLNAFILVLADKARQEARAADRALRAGRDRGPLHGLPISIKDVIDVRATRTTAASRVRSERVAPDDAPVVARLRDQGGIIIGKTNLHEFAFGTTNEDSAFGPSRNPHDPTRSPGGSSGGSAVSVAAGMALASVGTDTGGSIRIPAAACGIVGLKPSNGELPVEGVVPLSRTLDHLGPLARTVTDAYLVYRGLLGDRAPRRIRAVAADALRLAIPRPYFLDLLDTELRSRFEEAMEHLRSAGATLRPTEIPHAEQIPAVYLHLQNAEAAAYHASTLEAHGERYTPAVRARLEAARYVLAEDYVRARIGRDVLRGEVDRALDGHHALALPSLPIPAPLLGSDTVLIGHVAHPVRGLMLRLTQLFNLTGHPAMSIPAGRTSGGLPCGLQLAGPRGGTVALIRAALTCERLVTPLNARGSSPVRPAPTRRRH